jgi:hypothetical protein
MILYVELFLDEDGWVPADDVRAHFKELYCG